MFYNYKFKRRLATSTAAVSTAVAVTLVAVLNIKLLFLPQVAVDT